MIKAVIFDLDGTLSYTLDSISISGNLALEELGMKPFDKDEYKYFCGDGADELVRRLLRGNGDENCSGFDELKKLYRKYFSQYAEYNVKPYDGIVETLGILKSRGLKLAVLSNKPHKQTVEVISKLFGDNTFDFVKGFTEDIKRKPSPDGAIFIAKSLEIDADDFLYVGDTGTDMQTGNGAGMHTVGVLWGYRMREELVENNAEMIISSPGEIIECVLQFSGWPKQL